MTQHKEAGILRLLVDHKPEMLPILWDTMLNLMHEAGYEPLRAMTEEDKVITGLKNSATGLILPMFEETPLSVQEFADNVTRIMNEQENANGK